MSDLIIKKAPPTREELLANGAIEFDQNAPSQNKPWESEGLGASCTGYYENGKFVMPYDSQMPYDHPDVIEAAKRYEDRKNQPIPSEYDEIVRRLQEKTAGEVRQYRFLFQEEYEESLWHPGRVIWIGEFINLLQRMRPDIFAAEYAIRGLRGIGYVEGGKPVYSGTACMDGDMPEWSQLRVDARRLPKNERYRGWRVVLLALIKKGVISEGQCDEIFGKPISERARPWYRQLFILRNNRCPECRKEDCICRDRFDYMRADSAQYVVPAEIAAGKRMEVSPEKPRIYVA
jgi:hypothetical protein